MTTTRNRENDELDKSGENTARVGVYYVPDHELDNPPDKRIYHQKAVWTPEGWERDSEGEIVAAASQYGPSVLSADWIREWFTGRNHVVAPPDEVPGKVEEQSPRLSGADAGYEAQLRSESKCSRGEKIDTVSTNRREEGMPRNRFAGTLKWFARFFDDYSYRWVQVSFAFVFFYFGLQKWPVIQGASPVRQPVTAFVVAVGFGGWLPLSAQAGLTFVGIYEVTLGILWFTSLVEETQVGTSRVFVGVALMTVAHQLITFLPLLVVFDVSFRRTEFLIPFVGTFPFPVALDWMSAFIFKNLLFLGAFFYVYVEWAKRYGLGIEE